MKCKAKKKKPYGQKCTNKAIHKLVLTYGGRARKKVYCGVHIGIEQGRAFMMGVTSFSRKFNDQEVEP